MKNLSHTIKQKKIFDSIENWIDRYDRIVLPAPALIIVFSMLIFPVAFTLYLSFHKWSAGTIPPKFIGLENFQKMITDLRFWGGIWRTLIFVVVSVGSQSILGIATALIFNKEFIGKGIARTVFMFPMIATPAAMSLVWKMMFDPTIGILGYFFSIFGLEKPLFIASPKIALFSIALVDTWQFTPLIMIIILAGLASISEEIYDAVKVDGANSLQTFFLITLPLLRPTIAVAVMLRTIDCIKTFDKFIIITNGGPNYASEIINIYAYKQTFGNLSFGYGSSLLIIVGLLVFITSLLSLVTRRENN